MYNSKLFEVLKIKFPKENFIIETKYENNIVKNKIKLNERVVSEYSYSSNPLKNKPSIQEEADNILLNEIIYGVERSLTT